MFTIIPSLYLMGLHYFRQWKSPYYDEKSDYDIYEVNNNRRKQIQKDVEIGFEPPPVSHRLSVHDDGISDAATSDRSHSTRSHKKKSYRRSRKTPSTELTDDDIIYLMNKTGLIQENIRLWHKEFLRDCPDGKLSKIKFFEIYQQFYKKGRVTNFCNHAFQLFDKDGSGYLEFMEFLIAVSIISSKDPIRKIELFFSMFDIDRNGFIDENEMRSFVESIYELMGLDTSDPSRVDSKVHEIFSRAQCDSIGYLGKEQFAKACENDRHIRKLLIPTTKSTTS